MHAGETEQNAPTDGPERFPTDNIRWRRRTYYAYAGRLVLLLPVLIVMLNAIDGNLDRPLYEAAYVRGGYAFDIGYSALSTIFRDILGQQFDVFWLAILVGEFVLLAAVYDTAAIVLGYPTLLYLAAPLLGTQVRYAFAGLLLFAGLMIVRGTTKKVLLVGAASAMHISMLLPAGVCATLSSSANGRTSMSRLTATAAVLVVFGMSMHFIVAETRFSYYLGGRFGDAKSVQSLLYAAAFYIMLAYAGTYPALRRMQAVQIGTALLMTVFATATFIVLSGRMLTLFMLLEPIIISQALKAGGPGRVLAAACLGLGLLKFIPKLIGGL